MSMFKKFNPQDVSISSFDTHKSWEITPSNSASKGVGIFTSYYSSASSDNFSTTDPNHTRKWFQLDKLYYRNYPVSPDLYKNVEISTINRLGDWSNFNTPGTIKGANSLFGNPDYDTTERKIYDKLNIISVPSKMYGRKIKPKTFSISGSFSNGALSKIISDDGKENLFDTKWNSYTFIDNANRALYIDVHRNFRKYASSSVTDTQLTDDSLRYNEYGVNKVTYSSGLLGTKIDFNSSNSSSIEVYHNNNFNFNKDTDFAITSYVTSDTSSVYRQWVVTKAFSEDYIPSPLDTELTFELKQREFVPQYPFAIYIENGFVHFERNDGQNISVISSSIDNQRHHICANKTGSMLELYKDGVKIASGSDNSEFFLQNKSNILIGTKNKKEGFYTGSLEHIMIFDKSLLPANITAISESIINSPNIGNIFYEQGFATITNPTYQDILFTSSSISHSYSINFSASHLIYENEFVCNVESDEFLFTNNITARKIPSDEVAEMADFTTGSNFRPYVTSIGLYNNEGDLLAIGKLGQPVKMPNKIDTNFIVRFDK
jgi:hypothetical protein